eukprot:Selendium_serpulae@DN5711_c1_g1_i8.p1
MASLLPTKYLAYATHATALILLFMTLGWLLGYSADLGGFGWTGRALFNWHPLLMVLAFGVLLTEGVISWAWLPTSRKTAKIIHAVLHGIATVFALLALAAVVAFHELEGFPNFQSSHSWMGLVAMICLFGQLLASSIVFGGAASVAVRQQFLELHRPIGTSIWVMGFIAMSSGFMQKQSFERTTFPDAAKFINYIVLVLRGTDNDGRRRCKMIKSKVCILSELG